MSAQALLGCDIFLNLPLVFDDLESFRRTESGLLAILLVGFYLIFSWLTGLVEEDHRVI